MSRSHLVREINDLYSIKCELFPKATMDWFMRNWHHYVQFKSRYGTERGIEILFQLEQGIHVDRKKLTPSHLTGVANTIYTCELQSCPEDPIPLIWFSYL